MSFPSPGPGHHLRKYPLAKVGDTFGTFIVSKLLPRGYRGRSDERVEWRCECGRSGQSWVFNLRNARPGRCPHKRSQKGTR